jgi:thiol:disulfide interchange protein
MKPGIFPRILILAGIAILVSVVIILKSQPEQEINPTGASAETQLDQYLEEGRPVFAFFHSNNCKSCRDMIMVVEQVYPAFEDEVALVDVNVYDPANQSLLRRAKIYSIPTQVFIDASGQGKVTMGVMTPEDLRKQLQELAEGAQ